MTIKINENENTSENLINLSSNDWLNKKKRRNNIEFSHVCGLRDINWNNKKGKEKFQDFEFFKEEKEIDEELIKDSTTEKMKEEIDDKEINNDDLNTKEENEIQKKVKEIQINKIKRKSNLFRQWEMELEVVSQIRSRKRKLIVENK
jgi:hypothetical protein